MADYKKFLDQEGVQHLWSKINMQDYPNNETLIAVINAIDDTKMDKSKIFIGTEEEYNLANANNGIAIGTIVFLLSTSLTENITYYTTLADAVSGNNSSNSASSDSTVKVVMKEDKKVISLLSNIETAETVSLEEDVELELNDYTITSTVDPVVKITSNSTITAKNGGIVCNAPAGQKGTNFSILEGGQLTVDGGTYITNTSGAGTKTSQAQVIYAAAGTTVNVSNANITATDDNNGSIAGIRTMGSDTELNISNCNILVDSGKSLENVGVIAKGNTVIRDSSIIAKADYVANAAGNAYASNSRGIYSYANLELYDCYVWGAHSGVICLGPVYVNGGTYEGYGHGSFYLGVSDTTNYFYNCELNWALMQEGTVADSIAGTNGAGFYIGNGADNVISYFDNCKFNTNEANGTVCDNMVCPYYGIVFRTSGGETNNVAYISNSSVEMAKNVMFRGVGSNSHKVYNGIGNDWSKANKVHSTSSTYYIDTEDSYAESEIGG